MYQQKHGDPGKTCYSLFNAKNIRVNAKKINYNTCTDLSPFERMCGEFYELEKTL